MAKGTQYSRQFKEGAVQYRKAHPELTPVSYTHLYSQISNPKVHS